MKLLKKLKNEKTASFFKNIVNWIIGAAVGTAFGAYFTGNFLWAIVFSISLIICAIAYVITINKTNSKCDIIKIMKDELKAGNNIQVIRMGYPLSRPLHLSGRKTLRYEIGRIVSDACNHLPQKSIRIDDKKISVFYIKAKTLIDDMGWTAYRIGFTEIAIDNIQEGISIATEKKDYSLAIKGYRHLVGIFDNLSKVEERNSAEEAGRKILENDEYRASFATTHDYDHAVAEFDYAIAKTLIDDEPEKSLEIAKKVQDVFSNEASTDMDRYVKTFDLIGDIYAHYKRPEKLKKAKKVYQDGISKSIEYGRSERLLIIAIDYIKLLIKMLDIGNVYDSSSWETIDVEEQEVYKKTIDYVIRIEDKGALSDLRRIHKKYLRKRKEK